MFKNNRAPLTEQEIEILTHKSKPRRSAFMFQEPWDNNAEVLIYTVKNGEVLEEPKQVITNEALQLLKVDKQCLIAFGMNNDVELALMAVRLGLLPPHVTNFVIWPAADPNVETVAKYCPERVLFDTYMKTGATPIIEFTSSSDTKGKIATVFDKISEHDKLLLNKIMVAVSIVMCSTYGRGLAAGTSSLDLIYNIVRTPELIASIAESINAPAPEEIEFSVTNERLRSLVEMSAITHYVSSDCLREECCTCAEKTSSPAYGCARTWIEIERIIKHCSQRYLSESSQRYASEYGYDYILENINLLRDDAPKKFAETIELIDAFSPIEALLAGVPIDDIYM